MGRGGRVGWNVGTVWMRRLAHRSGSIPRRPPLRRPRIKLSAAISGSEAPIGGLLSAMRLSVVRLSAAGGGAALGGDEARLLAVWISTRQ